MREKEEGKGGERRKMQRRRRLTLPGRLTECARLPADPLEILFVSLLNLHFVGQIVRRKPLLFSDRYFIYGNHM